MHISTIFPKLCKKFDKIQFFWKKLQNPFINISNTLTVSIVLSTRILTNSLGTPYKSIFINFSKYFPQFFGERFDKIFKRFLKNWPIFNQNYQKIVNLFIAFVNILKTCPTSRGSSPGLPTLRPPPIEALPWWTSLPLRIKFQRALIGTCVTLEMHYS